MASTDEKTDLLATKLIGRYASDPEDSEGQDYIKAEVTKLLQRKESSGRAMTASDIQTLERKVEAGVAQLATNAAARAAGDGPIEADVVLSAERAEKVSAVEMERESKAADIPLDSYLVFATASEFEHERSEKNRRRQLQAKKEQMKQELDAQVAQCANRNDVDLKIEAEYSSHVRSNYANHLESEKSKRLAELEKQRIIKIERDRQLGDLNARRQREKDRQRNEEARLIERALEELKLEENRQKAKVREQRNYMLKVSEENEKNKAIKAKQRVKEQDEEKVLQAEYARRLDNQERARTETYERMKAKSQNNQSMYVQATAAKDAKDREDEARALAYQVQLVREADAKAQAQADHRQSEKQRLNDALAEQIRLQKARAAQESEDKSIFAVVYKSDAEKAIEEEKRQARMRRNRALKHKEELQKQIHDKLHRKADTDATCMTPEEKRLNLPTIRNLISDGDVVDAITKRLEKCKIADAAKKRTKLGIRGGAADLRDQEA